MPIIGDLTGGVTQGAGRFPGGNSLSFDGVDGRVVYEDEEIFDLDKTDPHSIAVAVKTADSGIIFAKAGNAGDATAGYVLEVEADGRVSYFLSNGDGTAGVKVRSTRSINDDAWHLLTATYDGSVTARGMRLYADGLPVDTNVILDTDPGTILNNVKATLGSRGQGSTSPTYFTGSLDQFGLWHVVLSPEHVKTMGGRLVAQQDLVPAPPANDYAVWWSSQNVNRDGTTLADARVQTIQDLGPAATLPHQATASKRPHLRPGRHVGSTSGRDVYLSGVTFDGVDDLLAYLNEQSFGNFTAMFVLSPTADITSASSGQPLLDKSDGVDPESRISLGGDASELTDEIIHIGYQSGADVGQVGAIDNALTLTAGVTTIVAVRLDGTTATFRIGGATITPVNDGTSTVTIDGDASIGLTSITSLGGRETNAAFLNATLFEAMVWDRPLSDVEITSMESFFEAEYPGI